MKKLGLVVSSAFVFCMVFAAPALASYPIVQGTEGGQGQGGAAGGTAFTGSSVSLWAIVLVALAVAGVTALFMSRRHAKATA